MPTKKTAMKRGCFKSIVQGADIYGQSINFTFQKKDRFSTCVGTIFTFLTVALMMSFTVNRCMKLVSKDDPFFSSLSMDSAEENVDLGALKYMFAVEQLDPSVGRLTATQTFWGTEHERVSRDIDLVQCNEFLPGGAYEGQANNENFDFAALDKLKKKFGFLCPLNITDMSVQGQYGSDTFNYVRIGVEGCN